MKISEYYAEAILDRLEKIQDDLKIEIITLETIRNVKIMLADLEYYYEKED